VALGELIACHECDLLHKVRKAAKGGRARCVRCGAVLYRNIPDSINRTLMLTFAGVILFVIANIFPIMTFKLSGREQSNTLFASSRELYDAGFWELATLVFLCSILFPAIRLGGMLYVLLPLKFGYQPWKYRAVFRWLETLIPWAMMEVYMLGILVAIVKLSDIAAIVLGTALYSFAALIVVTAWSGTTLDPREIWDHVRVRSLRRAR
jgi:paraquat-inducible protein A